MPVPRPADAVVLSQLLALGGKVTFGNAGLGGVTITVGGSQSRTATTDSSGNFLISGLPQVGNYMITPSKANYDFTPQNQTLNNPSGDQTTNFTASVSPGVPVLVVIPAAARLTMPGRCQLPGDSHKTSPLREWVIVARKAARSIEEYSLRLGLTADEATPGGIKAFTDGASSKWAFCRRRQADDGYDQRRGISSRCERPPVAQIKS